MLSANKKGFPPTFKYVLINEFTLKRGISLIRHSELVSESIDNIKLTDSEINSACPAPDGNDAFTPFYIGPINKTVNFAYVVKTV